MIETRIKSYRDDFFNSIKSPNCYKNLNIIDFSHMCQNIIEHLKQLKQENHNLYFIGNGASSAMSAHYATDFTKNGGINSYSLNEGTLLTTYANDYSYETAYMEMLKRFLI